MIRIYTILGLLLLSQISLAQKLDGESCSFSNNAFVVGDKLVSKIIEYPLVEKKNAGEELWDLKRISVVKYKVPCTYYAPSDSVFPYSVAKLQNSTSTYYTYSDDTILKNAFHNHTIYVNYEVPEAIQYTNVCYGQKLSGVFSGKGIYAEKDSFLLFGTYNTEVNGKGILITLEGDSLRNVLLQHTKRNIYCVFCDRDTVQLEEVERKWFVPACRYPVLETILVKNAVSNQIIESKAYYTFADSLENLIYVQDEKLQKKLELSRFHNRTGKQSNSIHISNSLQKASFCDGILNVELYNNVEQQISYGVYMGNGMVVYYQPAKTYSKGLQRIEVNLGQNLRGVCIFRFTMDKTVQEFKFILK